LTRFKYRSSASLTLESCLLVITDHMVSSENFVNLFDYLIFIFRIYSVYKYNILLNWLPIKQKISMALDDLIYFQNNCWNLIECIRMIFFLIFYDEAMPIRYYVRSRANSITTIQYIIYECGFIFFFANFRGCWWNSNA